MPRLDTVLVLLLAMPVSSFANADPAHNAAAERRPDQRQLTLERAWAERDAREVREFESMTSSLEDALRNHIADRYCAVNEDLLRAMEREIEQASVRADQAAYAARLSRREAGAMHAATGGEVLQGLDDGQDARDDARDRDDAFVRRDEMARIGTMAGAQQNEINRGDRSAMKKNLALARKFLAVMRRDLAANTRERKEEQR